MVDVGVEMLVVGDGVEVLVGLLDGVVGWGVCVRSDDVNVSVMVLRMRC